MKMIKYIAIILSSACIILNLIDRDITKALLWLIVLKLDLNDYKVVR